MPTIIPFITELLRPYLAKLMWGALALAAAGFAVWGFTRWVDSVEQRGWDRRDAQARHEQAQVLEHAGAEILRNLADAEDENAQVRAETERLQEAKTRAERQLRMHLAEQQQEDHHDTRSTGSRAVPDTATARPDDGHAALSRARLSVGTLRVLNDARAGFPAGDREDGGAAVRADDAAPSPADAQPTAVTGQDLALNDLQVVQLYHQVAGRHARLQRWVREQCAASDFPTLGGDAP